LLLLQQTGWAVQLEEPAPMTLKKILELRYCRLKEDNTHRNGGTSNTNGNGDTLGSNAEEAQQTTD